MKVSRSNAIKFFFLTGICLVLIFASTPGFYEVNAQDTSTGTATTQQQPPPVEKGSRIITMMTNDLLFYPENFTNPVQVYPFYRFSGNFSMAAPKGYGELVFDSTLMRLFTGSSINVKDGEVVLTAGQIYVRTRDDLTITAMGIPVLCKPGAYVFRQDQNRFLVAVMTDDGSIVIDGKDYMASKNSISFSVEKGAAPKTDGWVPPRWQFGWFEDNVRTEVQQLNDIFDILGNRIFIVLDQNNKYIDFIENQRTVYQDLKTRIDAVIALINAADKPFKGKLTEYLSLQNEILSNIVTLDFMKSNFMEFYFRMNNYITYFSRLIDVTKSISYLEYFAEFPDEIARSNYSIASNKIIKFTDTVAMMTSVMQTTYVNFMNPESGVNVNYHKLTDQTESLKGVFHDVFKKEYKDLTDEIFEVMFESLHKNLKFKVSIDIYLNEYYKVSKLFEDEFKEDQTALNPFFSLDDIMYKQLSVIAANDMRDQVNRDMTILRNNASILEYFTINSELLSTKGREVITLVLDFNRPLGEDVKNFNMIIETMNGNYNKYVRLLQSYLTPDSFGMNQRVFILETNKYYDYIDTLKKDFLTELDKPTTDASLLSVYLSTANNLYLVVQSMKSLLLKKYGKILFPKEAEFLISADEMKRMGEILAEKLKEKTFDYLRSLVKSYLIVTIIATTQINASLEGYTNDTRDFTYQNHLNTMAGNGFVLSTSMVSGFGTTTYGAKISMEQRVQQLFTLIDRFNRRVATFSDAMKKFNEFIQEFFLIDFTNKTDFRDLFIAIDTIEKEYDSFVSGYFDLRSNIETIQADITGQLLLTNSFVYKDYLLGTQSYLNMYSNSLTQISSVFNIINVIISKPGGY